MRVNFPEIEKVFMAAYRGKTKGRMQPDVRRRIRFGLNEIYAYFQPAPATEDEIRKAFERWAHPLFKIDRDGLAGEYGWVPTITAWAAWKAAIASRLLPKPQESDGSARERLEVYFKRLVGNGNVALPHADFDALMDGIMIVTAPLREVVLPTTGDIWHECANGCKMAEIKKAGET